MSYLALSQLVLTGLFYFCYFRKSRLGFLVSLLCFCLIPAVLPDFTNPDLLYLNYFMGRVGAATPAILWLLAHALFIDDGKVTPLAWCVLIGYQLARGFATFLDQIYGVADTAFLSTLNALGLLVAFGLALHVIAMATNEISNDLLEERRRIRGPFAAGMGVVMALLVAGLLAPGFLSEEGAERFTQVAVVVSVSLIFLFLLITNLLIFRLAPNSQLIVASSELETESKPIQELRLAESDLELVRELDRRMIEEKLFAETELTIGQLAKLLAVQEYKLRVIINRELGYKNFNQFLNHYRITESCVLLGKRSKHRNISIIAQDVGYASISTFNQAFKNLKGITPTAYKTLHAIEE
ncbi:MAG: hypothetical protein COB20_07710 [SAR86 cluster bacterium]|uniref:HTH araC/xylS-type domain-containing protein n=1 Tax=SAR86 cluster bacterium TaxID=2030880 RepID=A0A2A4X4T9_9GAMM|nr:MAG: hypothetical protein COB20_07710 [SAR86 cluster bacterium]